MARPVPKNVAAAIGLVPTVVDGVRRLPGKAVQLPVIAVGTALSRIDAAKREYAELADRGEKLLARLRGTSFDDVGDKLGSLNGGATRNAGAAVKETAQRVKEDAEAAVAVQATLPVTEPTRAAPTPKAAAPKAPTTAPARVNSAAAPEVVETVEKIASNVDAPLITDHSDLPLPDYDHMTLGALRGRLRSLDMQQLVQLRDYEKSKGDRLPVVTMLDNRIAKLSSGESVPTGAAASAPTATQKAPKKVGAPAAAKTDSTPPHTKVRIT